MTQATSAWLRGVFPPITTPFAADESFHRAALMANIARWNRHGLRGYVVLGSNGEFPMLSFDEKVDVLAAAVEAAGDRPVIAGSGAESTRETIRLTREAARVGARAALIVTPHYFTPGYAGGGYERHYRAVADASPIPVLVYNMPGYTGVDLPSGVISALASHPNIVGYKESAPNVVKIAEVVAAAPADFAVLAGSASYLYPSVAVGAAGGIMALANCAPGLVVRLWEAAAAGNHAEARGLHQSLLAANAAVTGRFGISGMKAALDVVGLYGGPPRAPLAALGQSERRELASILAAAGIGEA